MICLRAGSHRAAALAAARLHVLSRVQPLPLLRCLVCARLLAQRAACVVLASFAGFVLFSLSAHCCPVLERPHGPGLEPNWQQDTSDLQPTPPVPTRVSMRAKRGWHLCPHALACGPGTRYAARARHAHASVHMHEHSSSTHSSAPDGLRLTWRQYTHSGP